MRGSDMTKRGNRPGHGENKRWRQFGRETQSSPLEAPRQAIFTREPHSSLGTACRLLDTRSSASRTESEYPEPYWLNRPLKAHDAVLPQ